MAVSAAMYSTLRTEVLPPAMVLRPRIRPESRLIGATPTRAASWWRPMLPNSGSSARRVRAVTSPIPGTDFRSASASRQAGEVLIAWPMSRSTSASSFSRKTSMAVEPPGEVLVNGLAATVGLHADHLDDLASPAHEFGKVAPLWFRQGSCLGALRAPRRGRSPRRRAYRSWRGGPWPWRSHESGA